MVVEEDEKLAIRQNRLFDYQSDISRKSISAITTGYNYIKQAYDITIEYNGRDGSITIDVDGKIAAFELHDKLMGWWLPSQEA